MVTNSPSEGLRHFVELITGMVSEGSLEGRADGRVKRGIGKTKPPSVYWIAKQEEFFRGCEIGQPTPRPPSDTFSLPP